MGASLNDFSYEWVNYNKRKRVNPSSVYYTKSMNFIIPFVDFIFVVVV